MFTRTAAHLVVCSLVALAGCSPSEPQSRPVSEYLDMASRHLDGHDYVAATIELKNALTREPTNAKARWMLARVYLDNGNGVGALKELERAREYGVDERSILLAREKARVLAGDFDAVLADQVLAGRMPEGDVAEYRAVRAQALIYKQELDAAEAELAKALELQPGLPLAVLGRAQILALRGKKSESVTLLEGLSGTNPNFSQAWLQLGITWEQLQKPEEAASGYTHAVELRPLDPYPRFRRAALYVESGKSDLAAKDLGYLRRRFGDVPWVTYLEGLLAFKKGELVAAQHAFERTLKSDPNFLRTLLFLGAIHFRAGNLEQAEQYLNRYWTRYPGSVAGTKLLALVKYRLRNLQGAERILLTNFAQAGDDPFFLNLLGSIYVEEGQFKEGIAKLQKLVELNPDSAHARAQTGVAMLDAGQLEEGVKMLSDSIQHAPDSEGPYAMIVMAYLRAGRVDQALTAARNFVAQRLDSAAASNLLGVVLRRVGGKDEEAAKAFERAAEIAPGGIAPLHNLADLKLARGDVAGARDLYLQALKANPDDERTLTKLARLESSQGDLKKAESLLMQSVEAGSLGNRLRLVRIYLDSRRAKEAKGLLPREIVDANQNNPRLLALLGETQMALSQWDVSKQTFTRLVSLVPRSVDAYLLLARAHAGSKDQVASREALQQALKVDPGNFAIRIALMRQHALLGEHGEAQKLLDAMQRDFPESAEVHAQRAWFTEVTEGPNAAVPQYEAAFRETPTKQLAVSLALARVAAGNVDGGIKGLDEWSREHPDDLLVLRSLAHLNTMAGRTESAVAAYQQILELDERDVSALNNLANLLGDKQPDQAIGYAERALLAASGNPAVMDSLAELYLKSERKTDALNLWERALSIAPGDLNLRYRYASVLSKSGQERRAIEELKKLLSGSEQFPMRAEAQALLDSLAPNAP